MAGKRKTALDLDQLVEHTDSGADLGIGDVVDFEQFWLTYDVCFVCVTIVR